MFNAEDLRWEVLNSVDIPDRTQKVLEGLEPLFLQAAKNGESQIILRFRCKGGIADSVKKSLNTDVVDIFTSSIVTENVIDVLKRILDYQIIYVKKPFDMFIVSWGETEEMQAIKTVSISEDTLIDSTFSRNRLIILNDNIKLTLAPSMTLPRGFEFEIVKADMSYETLVQCSCQDTFRDSNDNAVIMQDAKIILLPNNKFAALYNITEINGGLVQ